MVGTTELRENEGHNPADTGSAEMTFLQADSFDQSVEAFDNESCIVQIYPPDIIDGMMLLDEDNIRIGRDFECDYSLDDGNVSRRHAEIRRIGNEHVIFDLQSTNGTFINGERIEEHQLRPGDRITIGSFIFKFISAGSIESHYHEAVYSSLTRDALTGAFNKRFLLESMQREIARSRRDKRTLAVVMMDIDHFKLVNDTHGHLVGDEVLREFGLRLNSICREDDLFCRYGGEEFCLLLASTCPEEAAEIAERCRAKIDGNAFETKAGELDISASFGVACYSGDSAMTPKDFMEAADKKLYEAKEGGRNRVVI